MKSIIFISLSLCVASNIYAQQPEDALRYSWITQSGTARNQAIGGASASLGGEFSTMFMNPAGLGFYKTNEFVITPYYNMDKSKSTYKNNLATDKKNDLNLSASGFIFPMPSYRN